MSHHENHNHILDEALRQLGRNAPQSDQEIEQFMASLDGNTAMPEHLGADNLAASILDDNSENIIAFMKPEAIRDTSGLAMAARNGKEISPAILDKMKRDRIKNESEEE